MKAKVEKADDRWTWELVDNEGGPVGDGWAWTETAAHAALRHAASLQWPEREP